MKKNIHPNPNSLKIRIGNDSFETISSSKTGEYLVDIDFRKHPAWNKTSTGLLVETNDSISSFRRKFGNISFIKKETKQETTEEVKTETKQKPQ